MENNPGAKALYLFVLVAAVSAFIFRFSPERPSPADVKSCAQTADQITQIGDTFTLIGGSYSQTSEDYEASLHSTEYPAWQDIYEMCLKRDGNA